MFSDIDFLSGVIRFECYGLEEDMLQVDYPNNYVLDVGWYGDKFIIYIIRDYEWGVPVVKYITDKANALIKLLKDAVARIEVESHTKKSYYGSLWETEIVTS